MKSLNFLYRQRNYFNCCRFKYNKTPILHFSTKYIDSTEARLLQEARKMVLIHILGAQISDERVLIKTSDLAKSFGRIEYVAPIVQYHEKLEKRKDFLLVKYSDISSVKDLMNTTQSFASTTMPVQTRMLAYNCPDYKTYAQNYNKSKPKTFEIKKQLLTVEDRSDEKLKEGLMQCHSVAAQMKFLHDHYKMSKLDVDVRYYICSVIEEFMQGILPECKVYPFGSLVSGLGEYNGDLDMVLSFKSDEKRKYNNYGLHFLSKQSSVNLTPVSGLIKHCLPLFYDIFYISKARVPIIECRHSAFNLQCDISADMFAGRIVAMLLQNLVEKDQRFAVLVFTLRVWARNNKVTQKFMMNNFMVVMLITHFLQVQQQPVLPSILQLVNKQDLNVLSEFHRSKNTFTSKNTDSVDILLTNFFQYYIDFDFTNFGISIIKGKAYTLDSAQRETGVMHIDNPTEEGHNVCKNVTLKNLAKFKSSCDIAIKELEESSIRTDNVSSPWGLLNVIGDVSENSGEIESKGENLIMVK